MPRMSALGDTLAAVAAVLDERELPWFYYRSSSRRYGM